MRNIREGDKLQIHCYKHNGAIHRTWDEATVLELTDDLLICANDRTSITRKNGAKYYTKEPAIMFFYKNEWFNVISHIKEKGIYYKCNMASPYVIDDGLIKCIDYDIDIKVFPDGAFRVLDRNEYRYHKKKMNYGADIDRIIHYELSKLINMKKASQGPFDKDLITYYYNKYERLKNMHNNC